MIHDVIERFRYRFQLWRREQREDWFGAPGTHLPDFFDTSVYAKPKYAVLLTESTPRAVVRSVGVYFGIIIIAAQICRLVAGFLPSARFGLSIGFLVFVGLWTLGMVLSTVDLHKARKAHRDEATKSSNQSLQLTAGRRDDQVSVHEPPFTPSVPRFRQR